MFLMFGTFIIACGTTHVMGVWNLWYPTCWLSGGIKAGTAVVSLATTSLLVPLVPKALPSPAQLEALNGILPPAPPSRHAARGDDRARIGGRSGEGTNTQVLAGGGFCKSAMSMGVPREERRPRLDASHCPPDADGHRPTRGQCGIRVKSNTRPLILTS